MAADVNLFCFFVELAKSVIMRYHFLGSFCQNTIIKDSSSKFVRSLTNNQSFLLV